MLIIIFSVSSNDGLLSDEDAGKSVETFLVYSVAFTSFTYTLHMRTHAYTHTGARNK